MPADGIGAAPNSSRIKLHRSPMCAEGVCVISHIRSNVRSSPYPVATVVVQCGRLTQSGRGAVCYSIRSSAGSRIHWDADLAQAAISGLFAALRARHDADRSVGKVAAFLVLPQ
jgi:hypothetical protein